MQETKKETYETPKLEQQEPLQDMTATCWDESVAVSCGTG